MSNVQIQLMTGIYIQEEPRTTEIVECLERNIANPFFKNIHIFIEDGKDDFELQLAKDTYPALGKLRELLKCPKVIIVRRHERPTYAQLFEYANATFETGALVMITNSDIEYDGTLGALKDVDMGDRFICLSREGGLGSYRAEVSQDTWIWQSPVKPMKSDWTLGIAGGDNKIAYEAQQVGYEVVNPCLSIYAYHRHASKIHHWTSANRIASPYLSVHPSRIEPDGDGGEFVVQQLPPNTKPPAPRTPTPAVCEEEDGA